MDFKEIELNEDLGKGIAEAGYVTCTPVQEQVITNALEGADLYVQSQTGTGKTAAYLITIFQRMLSDPALAGKKALIMVPTRELAVQVEEEAKMLGKYTPLKAASFYGGVGYTQQQNALKAGTDIIIGTPGRVIDLQESKTMDLSAVAFLVIDEADRMFDMGFYPDLRRLIKVLPKTENRQTMLFSATLNTYVKNLAWEYTDNAKEITIDCDKITVEEIDQMLFHVSSDKKMKLLLGILAREKPESVIVFCNTKRMSEVVAKRLKMNGYECEFIIGDLPQSKRLQVIDSFKRGSLTCLVATDVAARGIDVDDLAMVVNFDLPNEAENYVHRTGRTARAGKTGKAYTFCSEQDVYNLPAIEKYIEATIPSTVASDELMAEDKSEGVYIRTSRYEDDDRRGDRGGRHGQSGRSPSVRTPRMKNAPEKGRPSSPRRPENRTGAGERPRPESASRGPERRERTGADMSSMSFEQRMDVYRKKYGGEPGKSHGSGTARQDGTAGKRGKTGSGTAGRNVNQSRTGKRGGSRNGGAGRSSPVSAQQPRQNKPAPEQKTPAKKPGLVDKIRSLFGKKS